jgi:HPt (histidine-containing phosphotransfer) domain-containing protein
VTTQTPDGRNHAIDRARLAEQTFGEADLAREILAMFVIELPALLEALAAASGAGRSDIAHRIKGSSVAIGALDLADRAAALEAAPDDPTLLERLERAADAARREAAELARSG